MLTEKTVVLGRSRAQLCATVGFAESGVKTKAAVDCEVVTVLLTSAALNVSVTAALNPAPARWIRRTLEEES